MNFIKKCLIITILIVSLIYTVNITNIPDTIILFENQELQLGEIFGITLNEKNKEAIETASGNNKIEKNTIEVSLFNCIKVKEIEVSTIQNVRVIPLGNSIGLKLYSNGVLVIGMSEINGKKPYENTGIEEGDLITKVDNIKVTTTGELIETVNKSQGRNIEIQYIRNGQEYVTTIIPTKTQEDEYKLGLWVRDGAVGIGTATYYEAETGKIATLGHGIIDSDTDQLITIESGEITTSIITKIEKGQVGTPGQIRGIINNANIIGSISKNTNFGIYGNLSTTNELGIDESNSIEVATKDEIKTGKASILLVLEDGIRKEYQIEIKKIYKNSTENNKNMLIEITDQELIEKTGGIIQGMSGAPIIQNEKFIGAITHVLVNNPQEGYAVFGETMIKQSQLGT